MKALDWNPANLLKETVSKKEVKMGDENLEQRVQELEQSEELKSQVLGKLMEKVDQHQATLSDLKNSLDSKIEELGARLVELAINLPDEEEIEQRGFRRGLEEVASAFEWNAVEGEFEPIGRRIYNCFARAGLLKGIEWPIEEAEAEEGEAEELPEPPYLHVIGQDDWEKLADEERKLYFGWSDGKVARLVEA